MTLPVKWTYFSHIVNRYECITARQYTVCSLVYCTYTNRYSSALDTWAVFHTIRMRRLYTSQNEHFASIPYDIAVCIWIRYIRHHLFSCILPDERVQTLYTSCIRIVSNPLLRGVFEIKHIALSITNMLLLFFTMCIGLQ